MNVKKIKRISTHLFVSRRKFSKHVGIQFLLSIIVIFNFFVANCNLIESSFVFSIKLVNFVEIFESRIWIASTQVRQAATIKSFHIFRLDFQNFSALFFKRKDYIRYSNHLNAINTYRSTNFQPVFKFQLAQAAVRPNSRFDFLRFFVFYNFFSK